MTVDPILEGAPAYEAALLSNALVEAVHSDSMPYRNLGRMPQLSEVRSPATNKALHDIGEHSELIQQILLQLANLTNGVSELAALHMVNGVEVLAPIVAEVIREKTFKGYVGQIKKTILEQPDAEGYSIPAGSARWSPEDNEALLAEFGNNEEGGHA